MLGIQDFKTGKFTGLTLTLVVFEFVSKRNETVISMSLTLTLVVFESLPLVSGYRLNKSLTLTLVVFE